jgi:hypothetical protein
VNHNACHVILDELDKAGILPLIVFGIGEAEAGRAQRVLDTDLHRGLGMICVAIDQDLP